MALGNWQETKLLFEGEAASPAGVPKVECRGRLGAVLAQLSTHDIFPPSVESIPKDELTIEKFRHETELRLSKDGIIPYTKSEGKRRVP